MDYRLKKNSDFNRIFNKGKKAFSSNLTMLFTSSQRQIKAGFSVSKKHGNSVTRNRIKRLLRHAFKDVQALVSENCYFVFIPKIAQVYSFKEFKKSMFYMLKKSGLIKKDENN